MIQVTEIKLVNGITHQHISSVRWLNPATQDTGISTRATMVDWIRNGGVAIVSDGTRAVNVQVVEGDTPFIRTFADGVWTDNLLALPHFN